MKLIKGKPLIKPKYSDVYKFDLSFMIGDADGHENVVLFVSATNPRIERFLKFLYACENKNDPQNVKDYDFFCTYDHVDENLQELCFDWPKEPYSDRRLVFTGYNTISYFDVDNIEYGVTVEV